MAMKNPPHPGRMLRRRIVPALNLSVTELAEKLGMSRNSVSRVLNEHAAISPDFAVRLEFGGIGEAAHWLRMQAAHDLAEAQSKAQNHIERFVTPA
ncbi:MULTISPECIES: HigA family addiction module antitoxin [Halomonadaceae]|uniref:HigA family addiction module antitoxin n=1 Tax=Halomonadaceae TaxID=28256 RepID=UPI001CCE96C1|nr:MULTISPECIES: HigA family addiction module antitoxin [Halomonadaceae]MBZ9557608.1 HigA family addiction module antidote protein [Modicisalibacter sp. R2A 31.J]MBZ9573730.1 HigA family addiction module antidote protein [Modicisalibacter sp. MOD 31.J]WIX33804.1 HigA family addiction module antitoxin [Salinicola sp. JS01]